MIITQDYLKANFIYADGNLYRIGYGSSRSGKGAKIGSLRKVFNHQRNVTKITNKSFFVYRLIFLYHHGFLPKIVDHIDRNPLNDKIENLRAATVSQNAKNVKSRDNSSSQYLGVSLDRKYWKASINIDGKNQHIGNFKTEKEAAIAYNYLAKLNHGEFANLNVIV